MNKDPFNISSISNYFSPQNNPFMNGEFTKMTNSIYGTDQANSAANMALDHNSALHSFISNVETIFKANNYLAEGFRASLVAQAELARTLLDRSSEAVKEYPVSSDMGAQLAHSARHAHGTLEETVESLNEANRAVVQASEKLSSVINKRLSESIEETRKTMENSMKQASSATTAIDTPVTVKATTKK